MFIVRTPVAARIDENGDKVVLSPDQEVTLGDFDSERAFDRLVEIGAIEQVGGNPEIEIVPELWEEDESDKPVSATEEDIKPKETKTLTKSECVKLLLAAEVNGNGRNDETLTKTGLMKHTAAELNAMVAELEE